MVNHPDVPTFTDTPPGTTEDDPSRQGAAKPVRAHSYLFVVLHSDQPLAGGARYSLCDVHQLTLGRGDTRAASRTVDAGGCQLDVRLPSSSISSTHARLARGDGSWEIEDAASRNGTWVNGERVRRALLRDGDIIEIGRVVLCYRAALAAFADKVLDLDSATFKTTVPGLATLRPDLADQFAALERIARTPVPVLLLGESGTGKEVLAQAVHILSARRGPFVAVNCGGLPASLLESQLFGHVKGAFTGASRDELGFIRSADGGTLLLDEIGDLPLPAQAALLRVLQEREVVPVGGTRPVKVNLRVIAATHRPLDRQVARGEFRSDLLARLSGYRYMLRPLRERREDLGLLIADFLNRSERPEVRDLRLSTAAAQKIVEYDWPLNIRQLHQCLSVSAALTECGPVEPEHLTLSPSGVAARGSPLSEDDLSDPASLHRTLVALLEQHRGNVSLVARDMGKARMQIHRWMQRLAINPNRFRR